MAFEHNGKVVAEAGKLSVLDCSACGFKHLRRIPSQGEMSRFYGSQFFTQAKPSYAKEEAQDRKWLDAWSHIKIKMINRTRFTRGQRILDVGAGNGYFARFAESRGWVADCVEPSKEQANELATKFTVYNCLIEEASLPEMYYDAVHCAFVLEHLREPLRAVEKMVRSLKPGGVLVAVVPNDFSEIQRAANGVFSSRNYWVNNQHVNYFDFDSSRKLLERAGLFVVQCYGTFPIDWFLLMGKNYTVSQKLGRRIHADRKRFELNLWNSGEESRNTLLNLLKTFGENKIGREIVLAGRKS